MNLEINPLIDEQDIEVKNGCGNSLPCDPHRRLHRFLMLFFICFLAFGSYFCYDIPAALQDVFVKNLKLSSSQFMNLYGFYSWPNVFVCFIGGFLVDRVFGLQLGGIIFTGLVLLAQVLFALGAFFNNLSLMYIARLVLGIGGETLTTVQNAYCISWYTSSEITFVFGLQLSIARIGSTVTMNVMQPIYKLISNALGTEDSKSVGYAIFIGALFCFFSMICSIILAFFDRRAKRILKSANKKDPNIEISCDHINEEDAATNSTIIIEEKIKITDVLHFPLSYWLICIIVVTYYVTIFPFIGLGLTFFEKKYNLSPSMAALVNSLPYIVSAVASPILGSLIDFTGLNLFWIAFSILLTLGVHFCFAFTFAVPPILLMVFLGLGYSILASIWPLVGLLIPEYQLGTGYGILQAIQNLGLAVIAQASGAILDKAGYFMVEIFFIFWLYLALASVLALYFVDLNRGSLLNASGKRRRAEEAKKPVAELEISNNS